MGVPKRLVLSPQLLLIGIADNDKNTKNTNLGYILDETKI